MRSFYSLLLLLLPLSIVIHGCTSPSPWEEEGKVLMTEAERLEQAHLNINSRIDSLWDATTAALEKAIPENFPPTDREIFLTSRNADHIRMFMSFHTLSPEAQSLVNDAGKFDEMLAVHVRDLQVQRQEFEVRKIQFLQKVSQADKAVGQHYAEQLRHPLAAKSE